MRKFIHGMILIMMLMSSTTYAQDFFLSDADNKIKVEKYTKGMDLNVNMSSKIVVYRGKISCNAYKNWVLSEDPKWVVCLYGHDFRNMESLNTNQEYRIHAYIVDQRNGILDIFLLDPL